MTRETNNPTRRDSPGSAPTAFKREGPAPAEDTTGATVDEMNQKAEEAFTRNITPDGTPGDQSGTNEHGPGSENGSDQ